MKAIDRDALAQYHSAHVVNSNTVLAVFGDITPKEAQQLVAKGFGGLAHGTAPVHKRVPSAVTLPAREKTWAPKQQTIFLAGYPGLAVDDPMSDPLSVLREITSGLASDIAIEVRDKRGLAYFVGSYIRTGVDPGTFVLYAGTRADQVEEVEKLISEETQRLAKNGPRPDELKRAVASIIAGHEMGLQNNHSVALNCALNELYGLGHAYSFSTRTRMEAVTANDVKKAAATLLKDELRAVSIVLPAQPAKK